MKHCAIVVERTLTGETMPQSYIDPLTNQRRAETALHESNERLQAALNAAGAGTFRWNILNNALEWDENLDRLFGLPANQTIRSLENFVATVHPEDRPGVIELCRRCALEGTDFDMEFRVLWPDGSVHWLHDKGKMFFDEAGHPTHMTGACLDITRHKQAEKTIADTARRLHLALDAGDLGDWSWEARTEILTLSERGSDIFGQGKKVTYWSWDGVRGLLHPDDRERSRMASQGALKTHSDYKIEYRLNHPTAGRRWIATRGRGIYGPDGAVVGMVGVVQDVTEQRRAAEALNDARSALAQQNQVLEETVQLRTSTLKETILELEAFSYSISHDMRAPLRAMHGYSDALLLDYQSRLEPEAVNYLQRINRGASRLDLLIRDVLAYSRIAKEDVVLKAINLKTLIGEITQNYPNLHPTKIRVVVSPISPVMAHEALLTQIISNLLGNAVKFSNPNVAPEVRVSAETIGGEVRVWFEDNGLGIDPQHHQQIFQIFGRVYPEKKYEGTGIGLAIVKKAAERMGGSVGVQSELGKGSRFWITLKKAI
jgi:PAS domain S-box-containing protein